MKNWMWYPICFVAGIIATILFQLLTNLFQPETTIIHDTTVITRYETQVEHDTVAKFFESIVVKEVPAETIFIQKVDSVFFEKIKYYDFMLGLEKKNKDLKIFAINQNDSILKEQWFYGIGNDFTAFSGNNKIVVKTNKFYWNRVSFGYSYYKSINDWRHEAFVTTGVSYFDNLSLDVGLNKDLRNTNFIESLEAKGMLTWTP